MKIKILMVPAWYPTKEDPIAGSFFKEQAEALTKHFDFFILTVKFIPFNLRAFISNGLRLSKIRFDSISNNLPEIHATKFIFIFEKVFIYFI